MFLALAGVTHFWLFVLEFLLAAALVLLAGSKLAHFGDVIADRTNFSHGWIGFILLASITSLPELMTGISSTAIVGSVDLVISNTIGSNAFNIVILGLLFLISREALLKMNMEELITGYAGLFLLGVVATFLMGAPFFTQAWMSIAASALLVVFYFMIVFVTFRTGGLDEGGEEKEIHDEKHVGLKFSLFSLLIIGAAIWMTKTADMIAITPMILPHSQVVLGQTFVGALMLSIATSLPELSVTFTAARMGNVQMAVGNIFGSNIFNIFIIPISALFYKGNFWKDANPSNMLLVVMVLLVTALIGTDLIARVKLKKKGPSLFSVLVLVVWLVGMVLLFMSGNGTPG